MSIINLIKDKLSEPKKRVSTKTLVYIFGWQSIMLFSVLVIAILLPGNNQSIISLTILPFVFSLLLLYEALDGRIGAENGEAATDSGVKSQEI